MCPSYIPIELDFLPITEEVYDIIEEVSRTKRNTFDTFYNSEGIKLTISGTIQLASFDPMNIVRLDKQALHQNFINVQLLDKSYLIKQPVCAKFDKDIRDIQCIELFVKQPPIQIENRIIIDTIGEIEGTIVSVQPDAVHIAM